VRAVLIGGAALGAVGAASVLTHGQPAAAQALIPLGVPKARVGATFDLFPFKNGTTWNQAVDEWNARRQNREPRRGFIRPYGHVRRLERVR
jgi:hypothetical protein